MRTSPKIPVPVILSLSFALGVSGCSTASKPKPAETVTNQKPDVEAAYKVLKAQSDAGIFSGLDVQEFAEVGCRASQPINLETRWELNASVNGGITAAKKLVTIYQKAGWTLNTKAGWLDETKERTNGPRDPRYVAVLEKGSAAISIKNSKYALDKADIFARTPCVVQPLNREPETDPADPTYRKPTPSTSESFAGQ